MRCCVPVTPKAIRHCNSPIINQVHSKQQNSASICAQPSPPHLVVAAPIHTSSRAAGCCGAGLGLASQVEDQGDMIIPDLQLPGCHVRILPVCTAPRGASGRQAAAACMAWRRALWRCSRTWLACSGVPRRCFRCTAQPGSTRRRCSRLGLSALQTSAKWSRRSVKPCMQRGATPRAPAAAAATAATAAATPPGSKLSTPPCLQHQAARRCCTPTAVRPEAPEQSRRRLVTRRSSRCR